MMIWVAYNYLGDLVASEFTQEELLERCGDLGWDEEELIIGRATS